MDRTWKVLAWSFDCLALGTWPSKDYRGIKRLGSMPKELLKKFYLPDLRRFFGCVKRSKRVRYKPSDPEHARAGQPLAGGWRGLLVCLCGDLDFFSKFMQLPRPWGSVTRNCITQGSQTLSSPSRGRPQGPWPGHVGLMATSYKSFSRGPACHFCPAQENLHKS